MRRHAEPRHVDADDAHTVDRLGQQLQRHAAGGGHAQVDDHQRVELRGVGLRMHRLPDVLEKLAGDERLAVEGHVAHAAACAVEVRREREPVDAAGAAGQDRHRAAHPQAHAQRAERRAHALRLVVRPLGVVLRVLRQRVALACGLRGSLRPCSRTGVAAKSVNRGGDVVHLRPPVSAFTCGVDLGTRRAQVKHCRRPLPALGFTCSSKDPTHVERPSRDQGLEVATPSFPHREQAQKARPASGVSGARGGASATFIGQHREQAHAHSCRIGLPTIS